MFSRFFNEGLAFRVRVYNVIALTGMVLSLMSAVNGAFSGNLVVVFSSLVAAAVAVLTMCMFTFTKYRLPIKIITVTVVFCAVFPLMFFEVGAFGMIIFVLGVLFSSVLFEKKKNAVLICIALVLYYSGMIIFSHFPPFSYNKFNFNTLRLELITFFLVSSAIAITVIWLVDAYEREAEKLRILNENKVEFLSNFSHELKTPLTSVKGFAQYGQSILISPSDDPEDDKAEIVKSFESIMHSAEHLDRMGTQLLNVTMIEQGIIGVHLAPCSFEDIVRRISRELETSDRGSNTLKFEYKTDLSIIKADPDKLIQVLLNLMKNSARHTENGVITLSAEAKDDHVNIYVSDTGSGIPAELIPYLFKKYPQTEISGIKTDHGLGLFICKSYICAMGGEIALAKTSSEGTRFVVSLPIAE
jgi:signal transduction histidine kinase